MPPHFSKIQIDEILWFDQIDSMDETKACVFPGTFPCISNILLLENYFGKDRCTSSLQNLEVDMAKQKPGVDFFGVVCDPDPKKLATSSVNFQPRIPATQKAGGSKMCILKCEALGRWFDENFDWSFGWNH